NWSRPALQNGGRAGVPRVRWYDHFFSRTDTYGEIRAMQSRCPVCHRQRKPGASELRKRLLELTDDPRAVCDRCSSTMFQGNIVSKSTESRRPFFTCIHRLGYRPDMAFGPPLRAKMLGFTVHPPS